MVRKPLVCLLSLALSLLLVALFARTVRADPVPPGPTDVSAPSGTCVDGIQDSGAAYRICMPRGSWNKQLVVYAHGYVAIYRPVGIPEDQMSLPGYPQTVDEMVNGLGYAFAASSYYTNGLAVLPALSDLVDLVDIFAQKQTTPTNVLLAGVSEGGLITALAVEQRPDVFDGGLAMCGPYGSFLDQTDYLGDFRVLFDYFFPGIVPGSPVSIPASLMADWETSTYSTTVLPVLEDPANAVSITQILQMVGIPPYAYDPPTSTASMERLLWYSVYATNDATAKLGGQPFDNMDRVYTGSNDDVALNQAVARFSADPVAVGELEANYIPSGALTVPLVMMHTTGDALVPYRQAQLYRSSVLRSDTLALHDLMTVERYGHCSFTSGEVFLAFATLDDRIANPRPYQPVQRVFVPLVVRDS